MNRGILKTIQYGLTAAGLIIAIVFIVLIVHGT
jgi:hypothetical protein